MALVSSASISSNIMVNALYMCSSLSILQATGALAVVAGSFLKCEAQLSFFEVYTYLYILVHLLLWPPA